jgi:hypothetical protein
MNTKLSVDALFLHSQAVSGYEKVGFSGCAIEKILILCCFESYVLFYFKALVAAT